jgi:predicted Zn-dependent peptidase
MATIEGVQKTVLDNGVRVLCEPLTHVGSASVGLWCQTGSANEDENEAGITHLIEHMLFKGTKTRTAKQIAEEIEGRGGMLNAFTDRENTCYYCHVLGADAENAIDVLSEMVTDSLLDPKELAVEKGVVLEEIKRGEDEPSDHVHDLHLQNRWPGHILGKPIIGTPQSVSSFQDTDLRRYMARRYLGGRVLLAIAGNVDPVAVVRAAERRLGGLSGGGENGRLTKPESIPGKREVAKEVEQVHFCIGADGSSYYDEDRYAGSVMDGILGSGMSSRLFQEVREKRGLAYAIGSYVLSYAPGGLFTIYGGTSLDKWEEVQEVVRIELDKMVAGGAAPDELERTKRSIAGHIVISLEGMNARMIRMARNELHHGRQVPVDEVLAKINAVTNDDLVDYAVRNLPEDRTTTTAIGPFK